MAKKNTQKNKKGNKGKKSNKNQFKKPSACSYIKNEDHCRMPCKPVHSTKKGRKFLYCRTAISYEKMKKLLKKQDTATRRKFRKPMMKAKKLDNEVKKAEKVVQKKTEQRDGIFSSITENLGAAASSIFSGNNKEESKEEEPKPEETVEDTNTETPETTMPETEAPIEAPTDAPTEAPTEESTESTEAPTDAPTEAPTEAPTDAPTDAPTEPVVEDVPEEEKKEEPNNNDL